MNDVLEVIKQRLAGADRPAGSLRSSMIGTILDDVRFVVRDELGESSVKYWRAGRLYTFGGIDSGRTDYRRGQPLPFTFQGWAS